MRAAFRKTKEEGCLNTMMKVISVPLTFIRDYSCPPNEEAAWDRNRAAVFPATVLFSWFWLNGYMQSDSDPDTPGTNNIYFVIGLAWLLPGAMLGAIIRFKTKVSRAPGHFLTFYAIVCFVMAIVWISFVCNVIMDLLQIFGFITQLP
jgi:peptidoglycan/LPS O-acetylase OafA/YrhL